MPLFILPCQSKCLFCWIFTHTPTTFFYPLVCYCFAQVPLRSDVAFVAMLDSILLYFVMQWISSKVWILMVLFQIIFIVSRCCIRHCAPSSLCYLFTSGWCPWPKIHYNKSRLIFFLCVNVPSILLCSSYICLDISKRKTIQLMMVVQVCIYGEQLV